MCTTRNCSPSRRRRIVPGTSFSGEKSASFGRTLPKESRNRSSAAFTPVAGDESAENESNETDHFRRFGGAIVTRERADCSPDKPVSKLPAESAHSELEKYFS